MTALGPLDWMMTVVSALFVILLDHWWDHDGQDRRQ